MDPTSLTIIAKSLETILGVLICLGAPVAIVFTVKHFKLRHREIELEAELHGKQTQTRLNSIEARLGVIESALGVIARNQPALDEHMPRLPSSSAEAEEPAEVHRLQDPLRSR
ncbi:MAG TPA: hypothetical protein VG496_02970 [Myxococcales bacterium]|nr:hypothetical protein [Myxococcales bacterium]